MIDSITMLLLVIGAGFFLSGTLGILRFPDLFTRLHALTKADNLGLGFVVIGLALQASSVFVVLKLLLIWMVAMLSATTIAQLVASYGRGTRAAEEDWH